MKFDILDKVLTSVKDYHLPICFFVFVIGAILQWFQHLDLAFVSYTGVVLGAITGHAYSPAGRPGDPPPPPPNGQ